MNDSLVTPLQIPQYSHFGSINQGIQAKRGRISLANFNDNENV